MTITSTIIHTLLVTLTMASASFADEKLAPSDEEFLQTLPELDDASVVDEVTESAAENGCIRELEFDEGISLEQRANMAPEELLEAASWASECEDPTTGGGDGGGGIQPLVLNVCGPWGCTLIENAALDELCCDDIGMVYGQAYSVGTITVTCLD